MKALFFRPKFKIACASLFSVGLITIAPASAEPVPLTEAQQSQLEDSLATLNERLQLTDEQRAALEPILLSSLSERSAILRSVGIEEGERPRLSRREMLALRDRMGAHQKALMAEVSEILTTEQLGEFENVQLEARARIRSQIMAR